MPRASQNRRAEPPFISDETVVPVAHAKGRDSADIARQIRQAIAPDGLGALLVFFSAAYDPRDLARRLKELYPGVAVYGCTTAGELSPEGVCEGAAVAIGLPANEFAVAGQLIAEIESFAMENAGPLVRDLRARLEREPSYQPDGEAFALLMIDGLCRREELVVSALNNALDEIPLAGGSAGDDLSFRQTWVIADGKAYSGAAILLLVNTLRPFRVFKVDHFEPTSVKMVVTGTVAEERRITELDAEPAAQQYARAIGVSNGDLNAFSFAAHPVVVRIGGEYYARSIGRVNEDGSLSFFCAIDEGLVLTAARPLDMIDCMTKALTRLDEEMDEPELVLGFDCVLRRLDAEQGQTKRELSKIYRRHHVVGFNTYGEQYRSMHLNQTFIGVAIGRQRSLLQEP